MQRDRRASRFRIRGPAPAPDPDPESGSQTVASTARAKLDVHRCVFSRDHLTKGRAEAAQIFGVNVSEKRFEVRRHFGDLEPEHLGDTFAPIDVASREIELEEPVVAPR